MRLKNASASLIYLALALLPGLPVDAASLPEIRYRLFKDSQADVEADLRELATRGDSASQMLLADRLAASPDAGRVQEAVELYKRSFDDGLGQLNALTGLARLSERNPRYRNQNQAFFKHAIGLYSHERDFNTLSSTLEVFLAYPQEFQGEEVTRLINLYDQACVENCFSLSYRAALAELRGQYAQAESYYRRAMLDDARAVDRYYRFLGERQEEVFRAYAKTLETRIPNLPVDVVQSIGNHLSSLSGENDPSVLLWLDNAIARGSESALVTKASYMMSFADSYGYEDTLALIDRIEASQSQQGRALRASAYMVRNWRILDPHKAYDIIRGLLAEGYQNANLNLGELYSMGGLDEVDQLKAIETYERLADQGSASAFYRIATIYGRGRGICNDKIRAYAYAKIAVDYGELGAIKYLNELQAEISPADISAALQARVNIMKQVKVQL
ncbi:MULTISPECIES: tetratricopeptide repeat protein [unclassified Pseudomonas]|uniref:tetratricopeptide repeat protein n=1 Tax=unclassified Pseudomonas TaxID=196821 RepID=UPI000BA40A4F|nr:MULTISPECIES: sel1 repeat family protein [unclassified Pseudomonas]MDN4544654.1 sel1 repeat family protein [Pseudomonas sp. C32]